jgi:hypothetical protein
MAIAKKKHPKPRSKKSINRLLKMININNEKIKEYASRYETEEKGSREA